MRQYISRQWDQAHRYFSSDLKILYYGLLILFMVFSAVGTVYFRNNPDMTMTLYSDLLAMFESQISLDSQGMSLFSGIFLNNIQAGAVSILFGFVPFLFIPIWSLTSNALVIGIVGGVYSLSGYGIISFLVGILPHGILEIPAFLLGIALGLDICYKLVRLILRQISKKDLKLTVSNAVRIYFLWMVPLFFLAAIIETYMTPILFNAFS
ncbi:stage II sporulation protein M [Eubacteriaceae bacterium ES3]|nr:stage II sporulation protein M [Eubacteriaceae bacterium ES3]